MLHVGGGFAIQFILFSQKVCVHAFMRAFSHHHHLSLYYVCVCVCVCMCVCVCVCVCV